MTEESEGQLFVFTMGMYLKGDEPAQLTMSTNLADFDAWAHVFDTLRLNWERGRIRQEERRLVVDAGREGREINHEEENDERQID